jgi:preprotein translocase subunit SecE
MQLALTVVFIVLMVTIAMGVVGYLIDRSAARHERREDR